MVDYVYLVMAVRMDGMSKLTVKGFSEKHKYADVIAQAYSVIVKKASRPSYHSTGTTKSSSSSLALCWSTLSVNCCSHARDLVSVCGFFDSALLALNRTWIIGSSPMGFQTFGLLGQTARSIRPRCRSHSENCVSSCSGSSP